MSAAVASKPSAKPKPGPTDKHAWYDHTQAAETALKRLLYVATDLDLPDEDNDCCMATRLISVAYSVVEDFLSEKNLHSPRPMDCIAGDAFDLQAVLTSSLHYPNQPLGPKRQILLGHAISIAKTLTKVLDGGGETHVPALMKNIQAVEHVVVEANAAPEIGPTPEQATPPAAAPRSHSGFNHEQHKAVLETIAGRTRTLQQLLMILQGDELEDDYARAVCVDAAEVIATGIGALADAALGGAIIGGHDEWNYGPNFADAGKASAA